MRMAGTLAVTIAALLLATGTAHAGPPCGAELTDDIKLQADLDCTGYAGTGLVAYDDGVTINLNGHSLIGPPSAQTGIAGFQSRNVTVKNGTIEGYYHAIDMTEMRDLTVSRVDIQMGGTNDDYGVYVGDSRGLSIDDVTVTNPAYGFYLYRNRGLRMTDSKVTGGAPYMGVNTDGTGTISDFRAKGVEYGIYLYNDPIDGTLKVSDSKATGGAYAGFYIANANDRKAFVVKNNVAKDNTTYGFFAGKRARGGGNRASGNGTDCVKVNCD